MKALLATFTLIAILGLALDADAGPKLRACMDKVQTLTEIVFADVDDCIPSGTNYWLSLCPQDCWSLDPTSSTGAQVCCEPYADGMANGIPDGSCVTRSARSAQ